MHSPLPDWDLLPTVPRMRIDALQYVKPSENIFQQMRMGGLDMVHITVGYHEDFDAVRDNLERWQTLSAQYSDLIQFCHTTKDIEAAQKADKTALLFGLQNPLPFGTDLRRVAVLLEMGIRFSQITYNQQSLLGSGWAEERDSGLTAFGREMVAEMNRLGMIIDLSHAGAKTALETIAFSERPVAVTHANPAAWRETGRNLQPDVLEALAAQNGMLGFSLYPHHLAGGSDCSLEAFSTMVADCVARFGAGMFGIGSDLCQDQPDAVVNWMRHGHWRKETGPAATFPKQPSWFQDNRDFPGIAEGLRAAGLDQGVVDGILGNNWMRFFREGFEPL